jgi:sortase (surface protein transpeptidase)
MKGFDWKRALSRFTDGTLLRESVTAARKLFGAAPRPKPPVELLDESSMPKRPKGRPPKFVTAEPVVLRDLTPRELVQRNILIFVAVTMAMFLANLFVFSHIQHASTQAQLRTSFTEKLALATAPTSEGDENLILLADGTPVALLEIPDLGVSEIVVEGTDSTALRSGPGHRRDTVLPGQSGTSVIMGRASAFGGPFAAIHTLKPGTLFSVVTGQGQHTYKVIGMRYAGEPEPAPAAEGVSRIVLETGRGLPYSPSGVTRVDAQMIATSKTYSSADNLTGLGVPCVPITPSSTPSGGPSSSPSPGQGAQATEPCVTPTTPSPSPSPSASASPSMSPGANIGETPQPVGEPTSEIATGSATFNNSVQAYAAGARLTSTQTLPLEHRVLASDVTTVWALVFALQFLLLAEIGVVWGVRRFGLRKAWVAGIPIVLLASLLASDQLIRLLPNLT